MNQFDFHATLERYHTFQNPTSEEKLGLAMSYGGIRDGMRILDVGCGKAWLARRIAKRFEVRITGLEINRTFAAEARRFIAEEKLDDRISIVEGPALEFRAAAASFDAVLCIGASFALGGFQPALEWMQLLVKPDGTIAIGETFAKVLPLPESVPAHRKYETRSLWATIAKMRARGLLLRGLVESSIDDWNRYHSLHWRAALDWALEHPDSPDVEQMLDPEGQRCDLEIDGRLIGWAVLVAQNASSGAKPETGRS